jgi:outer membrane autotransporter protein
LEQGQIVDRLIASRLSDVTQDAGVWMQMVGSDGNIGRSGFATGQFDGGGAVLGVDAPLGERFTAGAAVDWNRLHATYDDLTGTSTSRTVGVSLYGRYDARAFYVVGRVGTDWVTSHVNRYAMLGDVNQTIGGDRDDTRTGAYVESGFRMGGERAAFTPFLAVSYAHLDRGGFTESGAGGWGLTANAQSYDQVSGQWGGRVTTRWDWSGGQSRLAAYALWNGVMSGRDTSLRAAFVGVPNAIFDVDGVQVPRNSAWLGIGVSTQARHGWSWFVNADVQASGGPTHSFNLSAGLRKAL